MVSRPELMAILAISIREPDPRERPVSASFVRHSTLWARAVGCTGCDGDCECGKHREDRQSAIHRAGRLARARDGAPAYDELAIQQAGELAGGSAVGGLAELDNRSAMASGVGFAEQARRQRP